MSFPKLAKSSANGYFYISTFYKMLSTNPQYLEDVQNNVILHR
jgi:hypothetical protein